MIEAIRRFLAEIGGRDDQATVGEEDLRLAVAALLFHVVSIDGVVSDGEREKLADLLEGRFGLNREETASLLAAAKTADSEAVDLYGFTSVLKRRLGAADRERIVEMMWKLVFADGMVHEFEDNLVWRVAELLGVSTQARIRLKQAVRDNAG
ncbi:MAG: TerB family tellurite resistance protein [Bauldia sp.]